MSGYDAVDPATNLAIGSTVSDAIISGYDPLTIAKHTVTTDYQYDDVQFNLTGFDRTITFPGFGFAEITDITSPTKFVYSGYIGISPYQNLLPEHQPFSFMKQLYDRKIISHQTVVVNIHDQPWDEYQSKG
jgi:hypothetical protein